MKDLRQDSATLQVKKQPLPLPRSIKKNEGHTHNDEINRECFPIVHGDEKNTNVDQHRKYRAKRQKVTLVHVEENC